MPSSTQHSDKHSVLLDPYGIYGTRTARRLQNMRRWRHTQQIILIFAILILVALGIYAWQTHRTRSLTADATWPLLISPAAPPTWDAQNNILLTPTTDGQIVATWPNTHPLRSQIWLESDFPIRSSPVLGRKYFYAGSQNGILYALDRRTGKIAWQYQSGAPLTAQPSTLGNLLFCGNDDGWITALREENGAVAWRRKLPSPIGDGLAAVTIPAQPAPIKLVIAPLIGNAIQKGGVVALDANNGLVKWRFPTDATVDAQQFAPPVMAIVDWQTRLFCANDAGFVTDLQASNGKYGGKAGGWKLFLPTHSGDTKLPLLRQAPVIEAATSKPRLFISGNDGMVRCADIHSGSIVWQWQAPQPVVQLLLLPHNKLLSICEGKVSYLLDRTTGESDTTIKTNSPSAAALVHSNSLWILSTGGTLQRFPLSK